MSDIIRFITYGNIDGPANDNNNQSDPKNLEASIPSSIPSSPRFSQQKSSKSSERGKIQAIGEFEVKVDTLEAEMGHLMDVVQRLLTRAEKQSQSEIALDEIELAVEVNGEGKISIWGTGAQAGGNSGHRSAAPCGKQGAEPAQTAASRALLLHRRLDRQPNERRGG